MGLKNYEFVPHPINEECLVADDQSAELRQHLHQDMQSDFLIFHPSRQHWDSQRHPSWEKGNDIFIRGFAKFVKEVNPRAAAVFVDWGNMVAESKTLLTELGVAARVRWVPPMPNRKMVRYIHATDLLADQFFLGAFGSTMPKALACGKPAMLYLNENLHEWCFPEMPPVINAATDAEVFMGLVRCHGKMDEKHSPEVLQRWYRKYHSNEVVANRFIDAYRGILANTGRC